MHMQVYEWIIVVLVIVDALLLVFAYLLDKKINRIG